MVSKYLHLLDHDTPLGRVEETDYLAHASRRIAFQLRDDLFRRAVYGPHPPNRQDFARLSKLDREAGRNLRGRPSRCEGGLANELGLLIKIRCADANGVPCGA